MSDSRTFLFLQGVCSPFHQRLARRLSDDGHRIVKLHFNAGDLAYWRGGPGDAQLFRGPLKALPERLAALRERYQITDQVLFGDCRPVHRPAIAQDGLRTHVFEEGYLRPYWITLEREGVNRHSQLPRDAAWFLATSRGLPALPDPVRFRGSFKKRAAHDVAYHLAGLANPLLTPRYRTHAPVSAPVEYLGYLRRFSLLPYWRKRDAQRIAALIDGKAPFFVLPLQLDSDAQIRDHSAFSGMEDVIDQVMASFARHAAMDARLCIKNHPLDMGLTPYSTIIARRARHYGVATRVVYLESGDLPQLLKHATGTVTVNSTVGLVALEQQCPTLALSDPIYRLDGLVHPGTLDDFWQRPERPDPRLVAAFRRVLLHTVQLNGGFYCQPGIDLAVHHAARTLTARTSPLEALL